MHPGITNSLGQNVLRSGFRRLVPLRPRMRFQHADAGAGPAYSVKRHPLLNTTMLVLGTIPVFTFALGTWQVQRLKWKVSLIDELTEKLEREPLSLPNKVK